MDPKDISQGMRNAAETTLAKAKEAVDRYMKEATRVFTTVDTTAQATQAGARDVTQQAVSYAEANIAAAFEHAQKLLHAQDPQEFLRLQQSYLQKQAEALGTQIRELGTSVASAASAATEKAKGKG
jgi:phasin